MRPSRHSLLFGLLCLCTACAATDQSEPTSAPMPAPSPTQTTSSAPAAVSTPLSVDEYILSVIPQFEGIQSLDQPIQFAWPNVKRRIKELEGSDWGYFRCAQPPAVVSAFYQEHMPEAPYNMREANRVERPEGTLGIYYHSAYDIWVYLWIVPQPTDPQSSYVIVAVADGMAFVPDC